MSAANEIAKMAAPLVQRALNAMDEAEEKFVNEMAGITGMCLDD